MCIRKEVRMKYNKIAIIGLICTIGLCGETETINAAEAAKHIGEYKTVCGKVVSTFYHKRGKGKQTYLNIDKAYPNQIFTILIWGSNRKYFDGNPEEVYRDKDVCVDGKISSYKGGPPQIIVETSSSIKILHK
tara:strand:+ start:426 stop:824 length:399 start_codon:yes stop_codon:yes gene_type:complete